MRRRPTPTRARAFAGVIVTTFVGANGCDQGPTDPSTSGSNPPTNCFVVEPGAETPFVRVTSASFPSDDGFNVDGINNAARGGAGGGLGRTEAGCDVFDIAGGRDNAFEAAAVASSDFVPLESALDASLATASSAIEVRLLGLTSTDVATDDCIRTEIRLGGESGVVVSGSGSMTDHVAEIAFAGPITFTFDAEPESAACTGDSCTPAPLRIRVERPVAEIHFDATNRHIVAGSILGGYVFVGSEDADYDTLGPTELTMSLTTFAGTAGMGAAATDSLIDAFVSRVDLHARPDLSISPCSTTASPNAISIGIAFASEPPF